MVERVFLSPSKFTIRDASSGIVFDSDNKYIKSGGSGILAGGYSRSPCVYGLGTDLHDYNTYGEVGTEHGFPILIPNQNQAANINDASTNPEIIVNLPHGTTQLNVSYWDHRGDTGGQNYGNSSLASRQNIYDNSNRTTVVGTFYWSVHLGYWDIFAGTGFNWAWIEPIITNINIRNSGEYYFPKYPGTLGAMPFYAGSYSSSNPPTTLSAAIGSLTPTVVNGFFSAHGSQTTLSLAVTP